MNIGPAWIILLVVLLSACSGPLQKKLQPTTKASANDALACGFKLEFVDERKRKTVNGIELSTETLLSALSKLTANWHSQLNSETNSAKISVERAYIHYVYGSKSAVVSFSASINGEAKLTIRSQNTGLNWANSNSEFNRSIGIALESASRELKEKLIDHCASNG